MLEVAVYDTKPYDREYLSAAAGVERIARVTVENFLKLERGEPFLPGTTL